ncbi:MAG TPA: BON domain-containing protein, partial [Candidatus Angelobacter sp.]
MRHLYRTALILVLGAGFASAQAGMQKPPSTPPTFPSQQQLPPTMQNPDENTGQTGAASTTALPKAQADIQSALRRQLPASADSVTVSVTDDNKIQLSGMVTSNTEKNQIEHVARSAAPDLSIVNKLQVANPPMSPGMAPTGAVPPNNPEGKTGTERTTQPTSTPRPMPPVGSSFMASPQSSSSPQYPSSSPNNSGTSGQTSQTATATNSTDAQSTIQKAL